MGLYYLIIAASAGIGGYLLGLEGKDSSSGTMCSLLAAMIFAVPMGFWLVFNSFIYLFKDGRAGFKTDDIREVGGLLSIGVSIWLCGLVIGWFQRIRARR